MDAVLATTSFIGLLLLILLVLYFVSDKTKSKQDVINRYYVEPGWSNDRRRVRRHWRRRWPRWRPDDNWYSMGGMFTLTPSQPASMGGMKTIVPAHHDPSMGGMMTLTPAHKN
jgi:hypothetical protein